MRRLCVVFLIALVLAACGDDEAGEDATAASSTTASTTTNPLTTTSMAAARTFAPTLGGETVDVAMPWHDGGGGAEDPAVAVEEFLEFFEFELPVELEGLPAADAGEGRVEILPDVDDRLTDLGPPPGDVWAPTYATLVRTDDGWVVTGSTSPAVVVETPFDGRQVASPLDVRVTNRLEGIPLALSVWSNGAAVVAPERVNAGSGVLSPGTFDAVLRWPVDLRGPAVLVAESRSLWEVPAVTTVALELAGVTAPDDRPQPATLLGPVGDQRVDIEYQRGVLLTLHEPGPCDGARRPVVVTGGPTSIAFVEGFSQRGYVVADVAWRTPGSGEETLGTESLRAVSFAVNDMGVALQWLRAHADELCLDEDRIVAMGYSFGGITSLSLAYSAGEVAPGDVVAVDPLQMEGELRDPPPGPPPELESYSDEPNAVVSFGGFALADTIDAGEPPAMLVHGRDDPAVPFALAERTCTAATAVGVTCELLAHDAGHGIPEDVFDDVDAFMTRMLDATPP